MRFTITAALLLMSCLANSAELTVFWHDKQQSFSQQAFLELKPHKLVTTTPWTEGSSTYEGILLADLMDVIEIKLNDLTLIAWNDYSVEVDVKAAVASGAFIAVKRDGEWMPIRDKGPFWLVFPWSEGFELEQRLAERWAVWQIKEFRFKYNYKE